MLQLKDYTITYPGGPVLHYGDIHIRKGELTGLFGPSGCGKTSLLDSLFAPHFPGKVTCTHALLDGRPLPGPGPDLYRRVSYCPQFSQAALNPRLTLREQIDLTLRGNGLPSDEDALRALLSALRLEPDLCSRRPDALSGGQQQRMVLLLCVLKSPRLLILDEPSSAIDLITLRDIAAFLEQLKGRMTILMAAHNRPLLERVADRILDL